MFGRASRLFRGRSQAPVLYSGVTLFGREFFATNDTPGMNETRKKILERSVDPNETGWDRLQVMFSYDAYGDFSPELSIVNSGFFLGFIGGGIVGAAYHAKEAMQKFVRRNVETQYLNHLEAKRALQDSITLAMMKGGTKWGLKLGFWTGGFLLIGMSMAVYRGKSGVLEYVVGGAVLGTLFKFSLGPKGMAAGALMGAFGGLVAGMTNWLMILLTGADMSERRYWMHKKREESNAVDKYRREVARRVKDVYTKDELLHQSRLQEVELERKGLLDKFNKEVEAEEAKKLERERKSDVKLDAVVGVITEVVSAIKTATGVEDPDKKS